MASNKLDGIQILRGYAAILVVVTHLWSVGTVSRVLGFSRIGGFGVDIFFVISGFIMCYSLKNRLSAKDGIQFLKKRAYRVYPIYLIVLIPFLIDYAYHSLVAKTPVDPMLIVGNLLLLPSFFGGENYKMLVGPAWTLSYELFFYVIFAGAMLSSASKNRAIVTVMLAIISMVALVNILGLKGERLQWSNFQYMIGDTLFLNFVIGCICYLIWRKFGRAQVSFWTAIGSALALSMTAMLLARAGHPRIICFCLPAAAIILVFLLTEFKNGSLAKRLVFLGEASYSIYLVHAVISHWKYLLIGKLIQENDLTGILLTIAAIAAGCVFYVFVENPITRALHNSNGPRLQPTTSQS